MQNNTQSSTAPTTNADNARVQAEAARGRAQLETESASAARPTIEPVIVSCQVSTYREGNVGSFAIQLAVGETTVTTTVALPRCCDISLRSAAHKVALGIINGHIDLARASEHVVDFWDRSSREQGASPEVAPQRPEVECQSFWVSKVLPEGDPDFDSTAWNMTHSLECTAAFAELAFHEID